MPRPASAKVIVEGNKTCVHVEKIAGHTGICQKCGRTKEYPSNDISDQYFTAQNHHHPEWRVSW